MRKIASAALYGLLAACGLAQLVTFAYAQDAATVERLTREAYQRLLGTVSVEANPIMADGRLNGCSMVFVLLARDFVYRRGEFIKIDGSFGAMRGGNRIAASLKVVLHDIDIRTNRLAPSAPASAYFTSGTRTSRDAFVANSPSDTPGAIFVVFDLPALEMIMDSVLAGRVGLAFARKKGGMDVQVTIETNVVDMNSNGMRTRSQKPSADFLECVQELISHVQSDLQKAPANTPRR
jgi:hypothetical protein